MLSDFDGDGLLDSAYTGFDKDTATKLYPGEKLTVNYASISGMFLGGLLNQLLVAFYNSANFTFH